MKRIVTAVVAFVLVVGMLALAGCSCSSNSASSSSASSSVSSSSASSSASSSSAAKDVQVPDLKGKTQEEAEKALADVKLQGVATNPEETAEVEAGKVFKQSIAAGTTVKEGEKVTYTIAAAPSQVQVPDVVGKTRDEAQKAIDDAGLNFENTVEYNGNVEKDKVIAQSIAAGTSVQKGTKVSVAVSLGAEPSQDVQVPNVIGMSWDDAKVVLESAGLKPGYEGDTAGVVVSQDVAAGTLVAPNSVVVVTLEAKDDGQNALMNFVGRYVNADAVIEVGITESGKGKVTATIVEPGSGYSEWTMSGPFDSATRTITYENGKRINYTTPDGGKQSREVVYSDGKGSIVFGTDGTLTWTDEVDHVADGVTFTFES